MKKRVFIISQTESFLTRRGQRHPDLAKYLLTKHYEVHYVSSNFYHAEKRYFTQEEFDAVDDHHGKLHFKLIQVPSYHQNVGIDRIKTNLSFAKSSYCYLKPLLNADDLVLVASRPVEILYYLAKLKEKKNFLLAMDVRDIWPDALNIGSRIKRKLFVAYCNLFLRRSVKKFDRFLYTCPSFTNWIDRYATGNDAVFGPLGFNNDRFKFEFRKTPRVRDKSGLRFVLIGLMQRQLNVLPFIAALSDFPNFSLDIYGDDGSGEMYEAVKDASESAPHQNVKIHGQIPSHEVPEILGQFDIGLVPMDADYAFPNKVFDYIALSLPILSMGHNDVSIFVKENKIGWATSFDVQEVKECLRSIEVMRDDYNDFAENLLKIRDIYSRNELFDQIEKFLLK